jgi:acetate kinase
MDVILTINGGSSSIKFAVFEAGDSADRCENRLLGGEIQRVGQPGTAISARGLGEPIKDQPIDAADHAAASEHLAQLLRQRLGDRRLIGIGHRVVHGGLHLVDHQIITAEVLTRLKAAQDLDVAHLPREIALIESMGRQFAGVPQVACFDSAFFKGLPMAAKMLPIPRNYFEQGVHRLGFHGLSYAYLMKQLRQVAGDSVADGRVILAHLGSGASMAAMKNGKPIDTSMSFTPTAGIIMGTRPGDLDPGLLVYLIRSEKLSADQLDDLLNKKSGLLGVSDTSPDMRDLLQRRAADTRADQAVELFCYSARKMIGAFVASLGGVDTIVFSGGIGEHSPAARAGICRGLEFLGIQIAADANTANADVISSGDVTVRVIATDEEVMIAHEVFGLVI